MEELKNGKDFAFMEETFKNENTIVFTGTDGTHGTVDLMINTRTAYARYAKGFRKPLSHLSHLSRWRVISDKSWTVYRNHLENLQKSP